jgi:hypothetical protein
MPGVEDVHIAEHHSLPFYWCGNDCGSPAHDRRRSGVHRSGRLAGGHDVTGETRRIEPRERSRDKRTRLDRIDSGAEDVVQIVSKLLGKLIQ